MIISKITFINKVFIKKLDFKIQVFTILQNKISSPDIVENIFFVELIFRTIIAYNAIKHDQTKINLNIRKVSQRNLLHYKTCFPTLL